MRLWKVLDEHRYPVHGGNGQWKPGGWMPTIPDGELQACVRGYHLCRRGDLVGWLGPQIWEAKADGFIIESDDTTNDINLQLGAGSWTNNGGTIRYAGAAY